MSGFWAKLFGLGGDKKKKAVIDWLEIEGRQRQIDAMLTQNNQLVFKQAIIEYDKLIDSLLKELAAGSTFAERLKNLRDKFSQELYNQLWKAHIKRNELVHEHNSMVADWELSAFLRTYREVVSYLRSVSIR